jgi:hypothetical protein
MNHQYHFGGPHYAVLKEVARVSALISDLDRIVRILETDIATEEEHAGMSDPFNADPGTDVDGTPAQSESDHRRARATTFLPSR